MGTRFQKVMISNLSFKPHYNSPMPTPFRKSDFKAAVRDLTSGKVNTGIEHTDALKMAEADGNLSLGMENTGFQHKDGTFYTRQETESEFGFKTTEDLR
jgi:hypothetical protein